MKTLEERAKELALQAPRQKNLRDIAQTEKPQSPRNSRGIFNILPGIKRR